MDANGARHLVYAIEQQQHWRQAAAVRDGHQPLRDPDVAHLAELGDALRRYRTSAGSEFEKRLLNGRWERRVARGVFDF